MTFLPSPDRKVVGVDGPPYELNTRCAVPGCPSAAQERHHLWRRSFLNGDYWWVRIPGYKQSVGNCVGLCHRHHQEITENKSFIEWQYGAFHWRGADLRDGWLVWQPSGCVPSNASDEFMCPTCKRPHAKKKIESKTEEHRPRKSWTISVPKDRQEDGADVLDTLLEEARLELARQGLQYGEEGTVRYFILSTSLALFVAHAKDIFRA